MRMGHDLMWRYGPSLFSSFFFRWVVCSLNPRANKVAEAHTRGALLNGPRERSTRRFHFIETNERRFRRSRGGEEREMLKYWIERNKRPTTCTHREELRSISMCTHKKALTAAAAAKNKGTDDDDQRSKGCRSVVKETWCQTLLARE